VTSAPMRPDQDIRPYGKAAEEAQGFWKRAAITLTAIGLGAVPQIVLVQKAMRTQRSVRYKRTEG